MNKMQYIICQRSDNTEAYIDIKEIAAMDEVSTEEENYTIVILKSGKEIKVYDDAGDIFSLIANSFNIEAAAYGI